jgi:hypothetical protein
MVKTSWELFNKIQIFFFYSKFIILKKPNKLIMTSLKMVELKIGHNY